MEESEWKIFWENYRNVPSQNEEDLFFQVGKTIDKKPISNLVFEKMIQNIVIQLDLKPEDYLMELCCGNGLLTKPLSSFVNKIYAFDFTKHLIETAKTRNQVENVEYRIGDAKSDFFSLFHLAGMPKKYLMNDSLAYFNPEELNHLIKKIDANNFTFLITGIPSDEAKWNFYNTNERKEKYEQLKQNGNEFNEGMGRWWKISELEEIAQNFNLKLSIEKQDVSISTYRINALFKS